MAHLPITDRIVHAITAIIDKRAGRAIAMILTAIRWMIRFFKIICKANEKRMALAVFTTIGKVAIETITGIL